jgi:glycosyltransferase involved in cell wall biosynthesis
MKILVLTQYFWPESFPISDLVATLRRKGAEVDVLTGQPNYPSGQIFPGYDAAGIGAETHAAGFTIYRVPIIPRGRGSAVGLVANYLFFVASAGVIGSWLLRGRRYDVVFVYAPSPITQAIPALFLGRLKRAAVVTWVQDLWPQSLESTGFVRNRFALRLTERLVRWIYTHNDALLGQSPAFVESVSRLAGDVPVWYLPQPGDDSLLQPGEGSEPTLRLQAGFNVVFAGNLGSVQALETVIDAADRLRDVPGIRFVIIGSGSREAWLRAEVMRRGLGNVQMPGRFPMKAMPPILAQASVLLVSLSRSPIMSQTIPGKLQAYLAAGRPIIASLDGEGARVVSEAGAGLATPAEDAVALADAVVRLQRAADADRARMGVAGRRYYEAHFATDVIADALLDRLQVAISRGRR